MLVLDEFCFFANIISTRYESFNPLARSPAGALLFFLIAFFFFSLVRSRLSFLFLMNEDESASDSRRQYRFLSSARVRDDDDIQHDFVTHE